MSFTVVLYSFSKKENSTARPSGSGSSYNCILKDSTGILEPSILIKSSMLTDASAPAFNYAYISAFNRYYYIKDCVYEPGLWRFDLEVDALASWKSYIGNTSLYVLRASAEWDGTITDRLFPTKADYQYQALNAAGATPWWDLTYGGTFIVGLLSYTQTGDVNGGINYVGFNAAMFDSFMQKVFNVTDGQTGTAEGNMTSAIQAVFTGLTETQARNLAYVAENPFTDYIDSIIWVPGSVSFMTQQQGLYLGPNYLSTIYYYSFNKRTMYSFTHTFSNLPKHPKAATRGAYLNTEPYTEYQLLLPCYGVVRLDAGELLSYSSLTVSLDIDLITGQGLYRITAGSGSVVHSIAQYYCNVGVGIMYGENKPVGTQLQNVIGEASSLMSANPLGVLSGIVNMNRERQTTGSVKGTGGGYVGLTTRTGGTTGFPVLEAIHYDVADNDLSDLGAPLLKVRTPSAIPGYIQAEHGDIAAPATMQELATIKQSLENGFFYE